MKTSISSIVLLAALVGGCASESYCPLDRTCKILAIYDEPSFMPSAGADEDLPVVAAWPATAIVLEPASGSSGATNPATLFLLARSKRVALTAVDIANFSRLAVPIRSPGIAGRWIAGPNGAFFLITFDSGGTAGKKVMVFMHTVVWNDPVQEHQFLQIMNEESRLPVFLADVDGDGGQDILVASESSNLSGSDETIPKYRAVSVAGGACKVLREIDRTELQQFNDLSRL